MAAKVFFVLLIASVVLFESEALYLKPRGLGFRPRPKPLMHPEQLISLRGTNYRRELFADPACANQEDTSYCETFANIGYCTNVALYYQPSNLQVFAYEQCAYTCGYC